MRPQKGRKMKNTINENTVNGSSNIITGNTTLAELISILGPVTKAAKTPTSKVLREEAGEPIASSPDPLGYGDGILVYSNGYAVYDNGSGCTVVSDVLRSASAAKEIPLTVTDWTA